MYRDERNLRRRAHKIGYQVVKGRRNYVSDHNGFMILDVSTNCVVCGADSGLSFCMELEDVENFLREAYEEAGLMF